MTFSLVFLFVFIPVKYPHHEALQHHDDFLTPDTIRLEKIIVLLRLASLASLLSKSEVAQ